MIVGEIQRNCQGDSSKVSSQFVFEADGNGVKKGDYKDFWVSSDGCESLLDDANGFLLAAFLPAWINGEKRIIVEGAVCPRLYANLSTASSLLRSWFKDWPAVPEIRCSFASRDAGDESAQFLSGGVDSLATLRHLTHQYSAGDLYRPSVAVLIDYHGIKGLSPEEIRLRLQGRQVRCQQITEHVGVGLVVVSTNLRELHPSNRFWMYRYHGALMAGIAHFLGHQFRRFYIAASIAARHFAGNATSYPWGSHPMLDGLYSSAHLDIVHHGYELSRLDKIGAILDWDIALSNMQVCTSEESGGSNCGQCQKCIRTKLYLLLHGVLDCSDAFEKGQLTVEDLEKVKIDSQTVHDVYKDCLSQIVAANRLDLAGVIEGKLQQFNSLPRRLKRAFSR